MTDRQNDRRHQQGDRTRARLAACAKLQFDAYGYAGATVRQIASAADLTTGAVFNHFPSKAAIYREVYGHQPINADQGRKLLLALNWALRALDVDDEAMLALHGGAICEPARTRYVQERAMAEDAILEVGKAILSEAPNV